MGERRVAGRRLAAILAADVAGYSRLIRADEEGTIGRLRTLRRELIDPAIDAHNGRIIKAMGDGLLIEFASVVDAVRCAVSVQRGMVSRNEGVPEDTRIIFRVGINLGDVVIESDGDLMGDGINVASRLEGLAEPGSIFLSGAAYEQVRDKLDLPFRDLGERAVKNIDRPVRIHGLGAEAVAALPQPPGVSGPREGRHVRVALRRKHLSIIAALALVLSAASGAGIYAYRHLHGVQPDLTRNTLLSRISIVVLPFKNVTGDASQNYLANVITEELTSRLSRLPGTFVIASSTAFIYAKVAVNVQKVGAELGVRYVLLGNEQHDENRVRILAQMIDVATGAEIWGDQFDTRRADLMDTQDELVDRLARSLEIQISGAEAARMERPNSDTHYSDDLVVKCKAGHLTTSAFSPERQAVYKICEQALQDDPNNSRVMSILALKYVIPLATLQSTDKLNDATHAEQLLTRALSIDSNDYVAHAVNAAFLNTQNRPEAALAEAQRSLSINPSFIPALAVLCSAEFQLGHIGKEISCADQAIRRSPKDPFLDVFQVYLAQGYFAQAEYPLSAEWARNAIATNQSGALAHLLLASTLGLEGKSEEAQQAVQRYLSLKAAQSRTIRQLKSQEFSREQIVADYYQRLYEGLRKAGMPEK